MFGGIYSQRNRFIFQPIQIDVNLLGQAMAIKSFISAGPTAIPIDPRDYPSARSPDIIAPWEIRQSISSLASKVNQVRGMKKLLIDDPRQDHVKLAGDDRTSRQLFVLYKALSNLETLARYSAEKNTSLSSLARLSTQFQSGMAEVDEYMKTLELDQMDLFFGKKASSTTSQTGLGKNTASWIGPVIQKGASNDPITGIVGNEIFDITITNSGGSSGVFTIDLSEISGDVSVNSLVDHINTILDAQGTFMTRFEVKKNDDNDFSLGISGSSLEDVKFTPQGAEPALYVVNNFQGTKDTFQTGGLTQVFDPLGTPTRSTTQTVAGLDVEATEMAKAAANLSAIEINETNEKLDDEIEELEPKEVDDVMAQTTTVGVATDSEGFIYVLGETKGDFGPTISGATGNDVFLNKMDSEGNLVYSRMVGAGVDASAYSIMVDANDNVIVAGQTNSDLTDTDVFKGNDAFVTKWDNRGNEVFTYQLDGIADTQFNAITVDASGDIIVGGLTKGDIRMDSGFQGVWDGLIVKINGETGVRVNYQLLGSAGVEEIRSIAVADDGNILVVTDEDGSGVIRKLDVNDLSSEIFNLNLGDLQGGEITDIQVEGTEIYVTGYTDNTALDGGTASITNAHGGGTDGFVMRLDDAGASISATYTTYVGGTGTDKINDITYENGNIYITGQSTGSVNGEAAVGITDTFVSKITAATGAIDYTQQYGETLGNSQGMGVVFVANGTSFLSKLGLPVGTVQQNQTRDLTTQTSLREGDHFYINIDGRNQRKITINDGDDIDDLIRKIKRVSFTFIEPSEIKGTYGATIKIKAINGATLNLISGKEGQDALAKLGINPGKIVDAKLLLNLDPDNSVLDVHDLGGYFGLKLSNSLHLKDKTSAKYALSQIEGAISTIQRSYRSLVISQIEIDALEKARFKGSVPAYMTAKIANFQDALNRLQNSSISQTNSYFF